MPVNIYDMADTWNDAGTTYTAIKMNVTDTASASGSLLMDLQVGGASKFRVTKAGGVSGTALSTATATFHSTLSTNSGFSTTNGFDWFYLRAGSPFIGFSFQRLDISSTSTLSWSSGGSALGTADLYLTRKGAANLRLGAADAAAPVAQTLSVQSVVAGTTDTSGTDWIFEGSQGTGSGAGGDIIFKVAPAGSSGTAQNALTPFAEMTSGRAFNIYNTYTDATNFERGFMRWNSNVLEIGAEAGASGGTARTLRFFNTATSQLNVTIDPAGATLGLTRNGLNYIRATNTAGGQLAFGTAVSGGRVDSIVVTASTVEIREDVILMANLPTADPSNPGQLWNDSGTLKIS